MADGCISIAVIRVRAGAAENTMIRLNKLWFYLRSRIKERSTWRGAVVVLSALGIALEPEQAEAVIVAGLAIGGLMETLLPEHAGQDVSMSELDATLDDASATEKSEHGA